MYIYVYVCVCSWMFGIYVYKCECGGMFVNLFSFRYPAVQYHFSGENNSPQIEFLKLYLD